MKLSRPETWDRELSLRGNKASVWEELIGTVTLTITLSHSSPFMPLHLGLEDLHGMMHLFCCLVVASLKITVIIRSAIDHTQVDRVSALSNIGIVVRSLFQRWLGDIQVFINTCQKWYLLSHFTCINICVKHPNKVELSGTGHSGISTEIHI